MTADVGALALQVKNERLRREWSISETARRASVTNEWLGKLERGQIRRPGRELLGRLAQALDLDPLQVMKQAGIDGLPQGDRAAARADFQRVVYSDLYLTDEQAGALTALYDYFTRSRHLLTASEPDL